MTRNNRKIRSIRKSRHSRKCLKNARTRRNKTKTLNSKKRGGGVWDSIKNIFTQNDTQAVSTTQPIQPESIINDEQINNTDVSEIQSNNGGSYKRNRKMRVRS
jgi:hypothetical protein